MRVLLRAFERTTHRQNRARRVRQSGRSCSNDRQPTGHPCTPRHERMFGAGHPQAPGPTVLAFLLRRRGKFQELDRVPGMEQQIGVLSEDLDGFVV